MSSSASPLPESRQELIDLVSQQATQIEQLEAKLHWFEEQFHLARHKQFDHRANEALKSSVICSTRQKRLQKPSVEEEIRKIIIYKKARSSANPQGSSD